MAQLPFELDLTGSPPSEKATKEQLEGGINASIAQAYVDFAAADSAAVAGLAQVARTGNYSDLNGKPTLGTAAAENADAFAAAVHTHTAAQISDSTATGRSVLAGDAAAGRAALGLGALATKSIVANADLDDMGAATIKGRAAGEGNGKPQNLTASQVRQTIGLGNVDNTSDADKPVSTAVAAALSERVTTVAMTDALATKMDRLALYRSALRPGDARDGFGQGTTGSYLPPLTDPTVIDSGMGSALEISNAARTISPQVPVAIRPGRVYQVRYEVRRTVDTSDPLGHAVELGVEWLNSSREQAPHAPPTVVETLDLSVAQGVVTAEAYLSLNDLGVDHIIPSAARYARPYVRLYGTDHVTRISITSMIDVTLQHQVYVDMAGKANTSDLAAVATSGSADDLSEGADAKVMTAAERGKIGHVTVTAPTDLDAMRSRVGVLATALVFRGNWNPASGVFPGSGSAVAGDTWRAIGVGGTVDGVDFGAGDMVTARVNNASTSTFAANWSHTLYVDQAKFDAKANRVEPDLEGYIAISGGEPSGYDLRVLTEDGGLLFGARSDGALETRGLTILPREDGSFAVSDPDGLALFRVAPDGAVESRALRLPGLEMTPAATPGVRLTDPDGFVIRDLTQAGGGEADGLVIGGAEAERPAQAVELVLQYGQSWTALNGNNGRIFTAAEFPRTVLTLDDGRGFVGWNGAAPSGASPGLIAGSETLSAVQSVIGPLAWRQSFDAGRAGRRQLLVARSEGKNGATVEELYAGGMDDADGDGQPWANLMRAVSEAEAFASAALLPITCPVVHFVQGWANASDTAEDYRAALEYLIDEAQAAIMAITGQRTRPMFLLWQPPSGAATGDVPAYQAHLDICAERPDCMLVGAGWAHDQIDAIHWSAEGAVEVGEISAIAAEAAKAGIRWDAPYLVNPRVDGAVITLDVAGAHDVVLDQTVVSDRHQIGGSYDTLTGGYTGGDWVPDAGFEVWQDGGSQLTIDAVDVGRRQIRITMASAPSGTIRIQHAWHAGSRGDDRSVNRGVIRADWGAPSILLPARTLRRWLASSIHTVTI